MGFSLKAMPQEIQGIISLSPQPEKVMFYNKFYFLPSVKEKRIFPGILGKPSGGRRKEMESKGAFMPSGAMLG